ncbi:hypothetical protein HK101_000321 [Irineochytrium annulatum]|nr:hypothetical protein HK101_000321 [Irineochytrium annulatum]
MAAKGVTIYVSSVSGNLFAKKATTRVLDILAARKIDATEVDISTDEEAKEYMFSKSGKKTLPQIFVEGEFKGTLEELDEANEDGRVKEFLGVE